MATATQHSDATWNSFSESESCPNARVSVTVSWKPFAGSRLLRDLLAAEGSKIGRRHVTTLMKRMGIEALYRRPRTKCAAGGDLCRDKLIPLAMYTTAQFEGPCV